MVLCFLRCPVGDVTFLSRFCLFASDNPCLVLFKGRSLMFHFIFVRAALNFLGCVSMASCVL